MDEDDIAWWRITQRTPAGTTTVYGIGDAHDLALAREHVYSDADSIESVTDRSMLALLDAHHAGLIAGCEVVDLAAEVYHRVGWRC